MEEGGTINRGTTKGVNHFLIIYDIFIRFCKVCKKDCLLSGSHLFWFEMAGKLVVLAYSWCAVYSSSSRLIIFWYMLYVLQASSARNSALVLLKRFIFSRP